MCATSLQRSGSRKSGTSASRKKNVSQPTSPEGLSISVEAEKNVTTDTAIVLRGARTHNLKNISCRFPHGKLTVITGPSGSGKSSLAFHTLYAASYRQYLESLNSYARQFFERVEKPDVDSIDHLQPAIALEQKNPIKHARSTVGTASDTYDSLRFLLSQCGQLHCSTCGSSHVADTQAETIAERLLEVWGDKTRLLIISPVTLTHYSLEQLGQMGYYRFVQPDGSLQDFKAGDTAETLLRASATEASSPKKSKKKAADPPASRFPLLVDRLVLSSKEETLLRLYEALRQAARLSGGAIVIRRVASANEAGTDKDTLLFQLGFSCLDCGTPHEKPDPNWFSFNHPLHACPTCEGYGRVIGLDSDKIIPNKSATLEEGAVHPFQVPSNIELQEALLAMCEQEGIPTDSPYNSLTEAQRQLVWNGAPGYPGIRDFFDWLESKRYKVHVRVFLARYRGYTECPDCHGSRLQTKSALVSLWGKPITELLKLPVSQLTEWLEAEHQQRADDPVSTRLLHDLLPRLGTLNRVGLGYLALGRNMRTLSGGEAQRVMLTKALGSGLTETLYVLDEPTVGLHARDSDRLLGIMQALTEQGNTLVVVEHDPDVMQGADHVIDIGPESGEEGGYVVYEGTWASLLDVPYSKTALAIKALQQKGLTPLASPDEEQAIGGSSTPIVIRGASGNNLKNVDVSMPTGCWVGICGVSGSGKSTLLHQTLYANYLLSKAELPSIENAPCLELSGLDHFEEVVLVDQSLPGRSIRSNPATYVKAYDEIRKLFANAPKAKALGLTASDFSFNSPGGRCERCEGLGTITIDMQFMADVTLTCPDCDGKRFGPAVLSVELFERNLNDVLSMSVNEAIQFFKTAPKIRKKLEPLVRLGLGYLRLGQSSDTLSGGEAQRLKLAQFLLKSGSSKSSEKPTCFLFDEPTTGLHMSDIAQLADVFRHLVKQGHTLIVIEHNLQMLAYADWLIELGPEAGENGGSLVYEGPVAGILKQKSSWTGRYLKPLLEPAHT